MNPYTRLSAAAMKSQPAAAARVLEDYSADNVARFLAAASPATAGQVIDHFTPGFAAHCLAALEPVVAGRIYFNLNTLAQGSNVQSLLKRTPHSFLIIAHGIIGKWAVITHNMADELVPNGYFHLIAVDTAGDCIGKFQNIIGTGRR